MLKEKGYFNGSGHGIYGAIIELDKKEEPRSWGDTSDNKKFYGLGF
ncbi:hypothetical protein IPdc08_01404 [archaeon]|nr:hypothetical protein IPdc08_01404 [archaeon]